MAIIDLQDRREVMLSANGACRSLKPGALLIEMSTSSASGSLALAKELNGLGYRMVQSQRFHQVDRMFAILIIFGLIGVVSDLALRGLRNRTAPWARP